MRAMERPRLAAEEALGKIVRVPEIEIADLRAFDADDTDELAGGTMISCVLTIVCRAASSAVMSGPGMVPAG
jgi:hypothetical protein